MDNGIGLHRIAVHQHRHPLDELRVQHQLLPEDHDTTKPFRLFSKTAVNKMLKTGVIRYRVDGECAVELPISEALRGTCWDNRPTGDVPRYAPVYAVLERKFGGKLPISWQPDGARRIKCKCGPLLVANRPVTLLDALFLPVSVFTTPRTRPPRQRASAGDRRHRRHERDE